MSTAHVFIGTSLDGFIAKPDGDIAWLLERSDPAEDHGYMAFIADKDAVVMGRGTYEKVLTFDVWPYQLPVVVLSRQLADTSVPEHLQGKVRFSRQTPEQLMEQLAAENLQRIYVDGGQLIQSFLRAGLVHEMILSTMPVLIGEGRRLFGDVNQDMDWRLLSSQSFPSGLVQSRYQFKS
ncbi:dihydrofolate reductase family protein [Alcaligenes phenolicus]|jgi:dihydrofolate reductase|uniref:Dihydrofolate reductase family protein n=1 Tax=Alcaligenes faecalis TaxID=511 RepID=A0AAE9H5W6_ALCFA|nr:MULTISPECIES: dihydrofolate reductase family protein [Alcaligenes]KGP03272.1 deaminase/reductase [Alcaligenes faecalis]MCB4322181.1 dihydrofolate reductase family protein [Alcaligenes sp. 13f]MDK7586348.1 dihydrofolate reductase family protein [Alcaligenes phenolicus]OQV33674.1 deaminase [Alcaligenes phenolicus]QCP82298.1 dihydrofolate reductase [Alcaligenes faecalis]